MSHSRKAKLQEKRKVRTQAKSNYLQTKKLPSELKVDDTVYVWNKEQKAWNKRAIVVQVLDNYAYKVKTQEGAYYIRTRKHLKKYNDTDTKTTVITDDAQNRPLSNNKNSADADSETADMLRKSIRPKKPVKRLISE